jgi:3-oxoacyl-[acyl-carrier-protein] synthase III
MPKASRTAWALAAVAAIGLGVIAFPTAYIMPFRPQAARTMQWALAARTAAPLVSLVAACCAVPLGLVVALRARRWWTRGLALVVAAAVVGGAWFARQNHFEWMFNPLGSPSFVTAEKATFVDPNDVVMAVAIHGQAAAYPIRQLAYHHLVNDELGGEPIVATY